MINGRILQLILKVCDRTDSPDNYLGILLADIIDEQITEAVDSRRSEYPL
jgi:hypothetical protein